MIAQNFCAFEKKAAPAARAKMIIGFVYVLSNPGMPELVKIGFTTGELEKRLRDLRSTGVAHQFVVEAAVRVANPEELESRLHSEFHEFRVSGDREFFRVAPTRVLLKLAQLASESRFALDLKAPVAPRSAYEDISLSQESLISIVVMDRDGVDRWEIFRRSDTGDVATLYDLSELERKGYIELVPRSHDTYRLADKGIRYLMETKPVWFTDERREKG